MKIFEKDERIHLQLMHLPTGRMLFDFSIEKDEFKELRTHIIDHLINFKLGD